MTGTIYNETLKILNINENMFDNNLIRQCRKQADYILELKPKTNATVTRSSATAQGASDELCQ